MSFWIIAIGLSLAVAMLLVLALRARRADLGMLPAEYDLRVYRDQLGEVERDLARGVIEKDDADRLRAEVARRVLAADAALGRERTEVETGGGAPLLSVGIGLLLVVGSLALYLQLGQPGYGDLSRADRIRVAAELRADRPNQAQAEASLPPFEMPEDVDSGYGALLEQLRATVAKRPEDLQGQILLAQNEANIGNYAAAARAQEQVLRLKGDDVAVGDLTDYADMLVLAAGGYVSPEAEDVVQRVLARNPTDGVARYYYGLMLAQTGRPDQAFRIWESLLREGPSDALWIAPIRAQIEELGFRAGVRYSLPPLPEAPALRGPSQSDIDAASEMTPQERMGMIEGMVAGLSERLATEGGPAEDWARLVTALAVLGRHEEAQRIYEEALGVFADTPEALDRIRGAGSQAGIAE
ncbi:c-type cytochrome biogenesis protein CcmI [Sulfitobacter sp. LCG007]